MLGGNLGSLLYGDVPVMTFKLLPELDTRQKSFHSLLQKVIHVQRNDTFPMVIRQISKVDLKDTCTRSHCWLLGLYYICSDNKGADQELISC